MVRASVPKDKPLQFSNHRTLMLRDGKLAVLSSEHTGWSIVDEVGYADLVNWLAKPVIVDDVSREEATTLEILWDTGLVDTADISTNIFRPTSSGRITTLLLKVTGSCNFKCTYCYDYDQKRFRTSLSIDRATTVIADILKHQDSLNVAFHGGEPLLRFDFIEQVVAFIDREYRGAKRVSYNIQTNGDLLNQEIIDFLDLNRFTVGISVDGYSRSSNRLRIGPRGTTSFDVLQKLLDKYGQFVRQRCGILAVASKTSIGELPDFALWLQAEGFKSLSWAFMDATGKGVGLAHEVPTPEQAVLLYRKIIELVRAGEISQLAVSGLISYLDNFFSFIPRDFCNRGPCAAANEFLVLDSENKLRSCDIIYNPFFEIGGVDQNPNDEALLVGRVKIGNRHLWLKNESNTCSTCPLFGLCGGTCVGKAIAANANSNTVDLITCNISKFLYPEILEEISELGLESSPLISYYRAHAHRKAGISSVPPK